MIKRILLRFLRRFYYKDLTYVDRVIEGWVDSFVVWFINIFTNGLLTYLVLVGIVLIFPVNLNLGNQIWQRVIILILLGLIVWYIRESYRWFRITYRGGKK